MYKVDCQEYTKLLAVDLRWRPSDWKKQSHYSQLWIFNYIWKSFLVEKVYFVKNKKKKKAFFLIYIWKGKKKKK